MEDHGKNILDFPLKEVPSKLKEYQEYMGLNPHGSSLSQIPGMQQQVSSNSYIQYNPDGTTTTIPIGGSGGTLGGMTGTYIPIPTTTFPAAFGSTYKNADVDWNMWIWAFRVDDQGYLDATATCRECGDVVCFSGSHVMHVPSYLAEHKCNGGIALIPGK